MWLRIHPIYTWFSNAYLVESESSLILVDAGWPGSSRQILQQIKALEGKELRLIFLTHAHIDHFGAAAALRRLTKAPIAIHPADQAALAQGKTELGSVRNIGTLIKLSMPLLETILSPEPVEADLTVEDGDRLDDYGLAAGVVHTPGHTPGSCSLLLENKIAIAGDLVSTMFGPHTQSSFATDWQQVAQSLAHLQKLKPNLVYPGHGRKPLTGEQLQQLRAEVQQL